MATAEINQLRAGGTSGSHQPRRKTPKSKTARASKPLPMAKETSTVSALWPVNVPIALHSIIHMPSCHSLIVFIGAALRGLIL